MSKVIAFTEPTPEMNALLKASGSLDPKVAEPAQSELALAFNGPLKQGVFKGELTSNIFQTERLEPGVASEYPLDLVSPGSEKNFIAYTIPYVGRIPERAAQGDYLAIPTYPVGNSQDWPLRYARDARWSIIARCYQAYEAGFIRKNNNDAWHTLLALAKARNQVIYDDAAVAGLFTKRLPELMRVTVQRNGGGNSTSINQGKMTDLFLSPEGHGDIRSWDLTQIDDFTRRDIFLSDGQNALARIGSITLHELVELGVGQEYQLYFTSILGGTLPTDKVELVIGLDLANRDSFVRMVREDIQTFPDPALHRLQKAGIYGWLEGGWAGCDARRILAGAF